MKHVHTGIVQKGTKRAASLGFPTLNIGLDSDVSGVYVALVEVDGKKYPAAAFADPKRNVLEAHILDSGGGMYGKEVVIELLKKVRDSMAFDTDDDLRAAIAADVAAAREYFKSA